MNQTHYEVCLHYLKAHQELVWNHGPLRLEVYADGKPQEKLIEGNDGINVWDLSDIYYRFRRKIQFHLIEDDGSELGNLLANFTVPSGSTGGSDAKIYDEAGYTLTYSVNLAERVYLPG